MRYRICPMCSQEVRLPKELANLQITPAEAIVMLNLYNNHPKVTPMHKLSSVKHSCLFIYVSHIRRALKDVGSDYFVETIRGMNGSRIGYRLAKNELVKHAS